MAKSSRTFRLGEVATPLAVSSDTVRRWVDAGRLTSRRRKTGERRVDAAALALFAAAEREGDATRAASRQSARNRFPGIITPGQLASGVVKATNVVIELPAEPARRVRARGAR